ncbi:TonB-dependent receptor [Ideonella sp. DXS29W]|uniref:TonB-dependent receptor n=1 Tax=Ideonella lacteola TaxID=2984193 RepID=A0ABU9BKH0_9BURK
MNGSSTFRERFPMPHRPKAARPAIRRTVLALACASVASAAWSQEDTTNQPAAQKIEVTGSRIKRIDAEGASPVQVLKREDIERTGASTVREMLATLSSATGSLDDIGGSNSFSPGASSASLRNLGKQSTLVLLNSRRVAAYPLADFSEVFSNLDTLPLEAVDRIEVLKSGGSALYGSDAVAGVINIITRTSYQGLQVDANAQQSIENGKFQSHSASVTGGFGDMGADGYNVLANLEYYHRSSFFWNEILGYVNPKYAEFSSGFGTPSSYGYPGTVIGVGPVPGCTTEVSGLCMYDRYQRFEVVPETDRTNLLVSGRMRLGEDLTGFAEVLYSHIQATYQRAYQPYGVRIGPTTWGDPLTSGSKIFYPRGLPAGHPLNPTGEEIEFRYRFADAPAQEVATTDQYRVLAGLQGAWSDYDWEVAAGVMGGQTKDKQRGAFSDSGFKEVIGDYNADVLAPDFFNKPNGYRIGQKNSDAVLSRLFPTFGYTGDTTQTFIDGKISGDIAKWSAGNVGLATGFDLRHEKMTISPTENLRTGDMVGFGVSASDASRSFGAVFAELSLPILKTLEAQVAGRVDHFPGFPTHFSPKVGLRYQPIPEFLVRSTYEGGFRAPNLTESAQSTKFAFDPGIDDPKRCPQALELADDLVAQADALPDTDPNKALLLARADNARQNECGTSVAIVTANNPDLKPETSRSFTLGIGFQPIRNWSATVDYWNIRRKNEIGLKSTQDLLTVEDTLPANTITRDTVANDPTFTAAERAAYGVSVGALQSVHGQFENLLQTKTAGVDMSVKGEVATPIGPVSMDVDATYLLSYYAWSTTRNGWGDNLAGRYTFPRWTVNFTTGLKTGDFSQSLRYAWNSSTALQYDFDDSTWSPEGCADNGLTPGQCKVSEYSRWDYSVAYTGIKNLVLGVHVRNVFNQRPPVDLRDFGFGGIIPSSYEDAQGRMLKLSLQYKFM